MKDIAGSQLENPFAGERFEVLPKQENVIDLADAAKSPEEIAADLFIAQAPPLRFIRKKWYMHNDRFWQSTSDDTIEARVEKGFSRITAKKTAKFIYGVRNMIRMKVSELDDSRTMLVAPYMWDGNKIIVNCPNCELHISTIDGSYTQEKHNPEHLFTSEIATRFVPEAKGKLFKEVFMRTIPDRKDRECIIKLAACILIPGSHWQIVTILLGPTGSGKSTILFALANVFARTNCSFVSLKTLTQDYKNRVMGSLENSMLNVSTELDKMDIYSLAIFNMTVSGEERYTDIKWEKERSMKTFAKFMFACNVLPTFHSSLDAEAAVRRIRVYVAPNRLSEEENDPNLLMKLDAPEEREAILARLVRALPQVIEGSRAGLDGGKLSSAENVRLKLVSNPCRYFLNNYCCEIGRAETPTREAAAAYKKFLINHFPETWEKHYNRFGSDLKDNGITKHHPRKGPNNSPVWCYGLALRGNFPERK
jgi:phage/plasmid-associated DNA primase